LDEANPYHWDTVYALHTDYLVVARAANACSAHFTALVYIERWCEERYGSVGLPGATAAAVAAERGGGSSGRGGSGSVGGAAAASSAWPTLLDKLLPAATQGPAPNQRPPSRTQQQPAHSRSATPAAAATAAATASAAAAAAAAAETEEAQISQVEALLLGLYERVNDPDGVYAIAALMDSRCGRLALQRHEGRWAEVLVATDQQLQHPHAASGAAAAAAECGPELELLRALERLGCHHTAQRYLRGAYRGPGGGEAAAAGSAGGSASTSSSSSSMREMQAQLAWRLGEWETRGATAAAGSDGTANSCSSTNASGTSTGSRGGFHSAILRSLQLLRAGDGDAFSSVLSDARHAAVNALATSGDESAVTINRSLVRLQMLELLRRAWGLRWTAVSHAGVTGLHSPGMSPVTQVTPSLVTGDGSSCSSVSTTEQLLKQLVGPLRSVSHAGAAGEIPPAEAGVPASVMLLRRGEYHQSEQLLALQAAITQILDRWVWVFWGEIGGCFVKARLAGWGCG